MKQGVSYHLVEKLEIFADIISKGINHFRQLMLMTLKLLISMYAKVGSVK